VSRRKKPNLKNRIDEKIENEVVKMAHRLSGIWSETCFLMNFAKLVIFVSPAGVRCIWQRHDLESFKKRPVLEKRSAELGLVYTEAQIAH
jgi:hypothetical protein